MEQSGLYTKTGIDKRLIGIDKKANGPLARLPSGYVRKEDYSEKFIWAGLVQAWRWGKQTIGAIINLPSCLVFYCGP